MTRLIDADALREKVMQKYDYVEEYLEDIDSQPTVYDVERVVAELEEASFEQYYEDYFVAIDKDDAIDIVKRGGIDE